MRARLLNGLAFNVSWFLIVYTQSNVLGLLVASAHVWLHMLCLGRGRAEWLFILLVAAMGLCLDQLLFVAGVFLLDGVSAVAPLWLSCLWPVLASTCMHVFAPLAARPLMAAAFGAVGGYCSYMLGTSISSVDFGLATSPLLLALLWALLFPALLYLAMCLQPSVEAPDYA